MAINDELTEYDKFRLCTKIVNRRSKGRVIIDCKLGLWGVDAPDMQQAVDEAKRYFLQYLADGEYDELLKPKKGLTPDFFIIDDIK